MKPYETSFLGVWSGCGPDIGEHFWHVVSVEACRTIPRFQSEPKPQIHHVFRIHNPNDMLMDLYRVQVICFEISIINSHTLKFPLTENQRLGHCGDLSQVDPGRCCDLVVRGNTLVSTNKRLGGKYIDRTETEGEDTPRQLDWLDKVEVFSFLLIWLILIWMTRWL